MVGENRNGKDSMTPTLNRSCMHIEEDMLGILFLLFIIGYNLYPRGYTRIYIVCS